MSSLQPHRRRGFAVLSSSALLLTACGGSGQNVVRADAARRFECEEARVHVESWGPRTVRAAGCGRSLVYSCQQARGLEQAPTRLTPLTQAEAQPQQPGGTCTWVPSE